ncbi:hypothetical protein KIV66_gp85 [Mycobacterium phage MyraDee]|uniref:Uncharacterized protein n=1 Tax=Mycobacterium phage MyraDee TaxID=2024303 RepID=A0A222YY16_9CAUD|nr:hypothetical protein KIV66_gp85 [Mycobacterium phage MyraDee]ASR77192.1 hypothetical protein SEA_MYRADEE_85 [Mycobacterium phage MyraDee]
MSVLVIGQHYWGHAEDLAGAKAKFRKLGGKLSLGYTIAEFPEGLEFKGVDQLGRVFWSGDGEPTVTEVNPKVKR